MRYRLILFFIAVWAAGCLSAQEVPSSKSKKERLDSLLESKYYRGKYDTAYIVRPPGKITLKVRANFSGSTLKTDGEINGTPISSDLSTRTRTTFSIGASYRGIGASIAFNPFKLKGESKDYEFNLNIYNNRWGVDVAYQDTKTLSGTILTGDSHTFQLTKDMISMRMLYITGYYAFNHRRFSYPAAFTQTFIQKRSAGSWLAGFSYQGGRMKTTLNIPEDAPQLREYVGHFALGGGYAYNLVVAKHWLFHVTAMPTIIIGNYYNIQVENERRDMDTRFPDFILTGRLAVIRNFERCFAGATLMVTHSILNNEKMEANYWRWRARVVFGYRF